MRVAEELLARISKFYNVELVLKAGSFLTSRQQISFVPAATFQPESRNNINQQFGAFYLYFEIKYNYFIELLYDLQAFQELISH